MKDGHDIVKDGHDIVKDDHDIVKDGHDIVVRGERIPLDVGYLEISLLDLFDLTLIHGLIGKRNVFDARI